MRSWVLKVDQVERASSPQSPEDEGLVGALARALLLRKGAIHGEGMVLTLTQYLSPKTCICLVRTAWTLSLIDVLNFEGERRGRASFPC